jgi:hypothetical protein
MRVRLHRWRLDRELAQGLGCVGSDARRLRALQLATPRHRRRLARSIRRIAESDPRRVSPFFPAISIRPEATPWREALAGLAERLQSPAPVNACGIARAIELVSDGTGPLYNRHAGIRLGDAIWWVADGLQAEWREPEDEPAAVEAEIADGPRSCPPHVWGCPVIMKLDPAYVAWTCARCGAVATTGDRTVRPG